MDTTNPGPRSLSDLVEQLAAEEANHNPDHDVPIRSLRMTPAGTLSVPALGDLAMNDWSRGQFAKVLGLTWDRWFAGAAPQDEAEEVNRRLSRARGGVRLRTSRQVPAGVEAQGTVRAMVSREYTTIPDTKITTLLRDALRTGEDDVRVVRSHVTPLTTSFVLKLGKTYRPGGPGEVGDVWGGLHVRNSGVGYTKLVVSLFLHRLVCKNGMVVPLPDAHLLHTRHRGVDEREIRDALVRGLRDVGDRLHRGADVMGYSANYQVENVEGEVRGVLRDGGLPARLLGDVMRAFSREPHWSRFGVSQALTLAAQHQTPEVRFDLESLAGRYLARQ